MSSSFTLPSESIKRRTRLAKGPFEIGLRLGSTFENELAVLTGSNLEEETFKYGHMGPEHASRENEFFVFLH